jgi:hypothetical protein
MHNMVNVTSVSMLQLTAQIVLQKLTQEHSAPESIHSVSS